MKRTQRESVSGLVIQRTGGDSDDVVVGNAYRQSRSVSRTVSILVPRRLGLGRLISYIVAIFVLMSMTIAMLKVIVSSIEWGFISVVFTYAALARFLNKTRIQVRNGRLTVGQRPLWWPGSRKFDADSIVQVYCTANAQPSRWGAPGETFDVHLALRDGTRRVLVSGVPRREQGLLVEQELERVLGLGDLRVQGEVSKAGSVTR